MELDAALAQVGGYRRWHLAIFSFLGVFGFMPLCWQGIAIVFLGITYDHNCKIPVGQEKNNTIPWVKGETNSHWHKCEMYINSSLSNSTTACTDGWSYTSQPNEVSIVSEWDLVCDKDYMSDLSQTVYQAGGLIGDIFCAVLVDKYGRKKMFIVGTFLSGLFGAVTALAPNYHVFCVLKAVTAVVVMGQCWSAETLMMEIFDSKRRAFAGIGLEGLWVLDYVLLGGLAYYLRNWRHLQVVMSLLVMPAMLAIWILPESPLWLVANGKIEEAEKVLQDMARYNGIKVPARLLGSTSDKPAEEQVLSEAVNNNGAEEDTVMGVKESTEEAERLAAELPVYSWTKLFTDPTIRLCTIVGSLLWFANSVVYYALILQSPSLPGNVYFNFTLGAIIEIPAYIICYFIIMWWGRRIPTVIFHILAGIFLVVVTVIPQTTDGGTDLSILVIILTLAGKFAITISFAIVILYCKEIFPTNLRASSGGICAVPAHFGTMVAPFASYAAKHIPWLPNLILGALSIIAAGVTMLLPETMGRPLPHTIEDVKTMFQDHKICSVRIPHTGSERTEGSHDHPMRTEL